MSARSKFTVQGRSAGKLTGAVASVLCFSTIAYGDPVVPQPKSGDPLAALTPAQLGRFNVGRVKYNTVLTPENGLGPCFNKSSCGNCHSNPLGGTGTQFVTRFGKVDKGVFDPMDYLGGSLLQASAISAECLEEVPRDATINTHRITNGALAYGLVEAIPDASLLAVRDAQDNSPGHNVRGIAHMVTAFEDPVPVPPNPPILHVGRFGWKAQVATVLTFSADASLNEMGLTNRFIQTENAPNGDQAQLALCDTVADPEDGPDGEGLDFIDHITFFQRYLSQPPQTPKSGMTGEMIFNNLGCAVCHTPTFVTSNSVSLESALRNQVIHPYGDFLLHDMGLNGDPIVQGQGVEQMVKTAPLWNLRKRDPMWHDGSIIASDFAAGIDQAILKHDDGFGFSQGRFAAQAYANLSQAEKDQLTAFLNSLGRREFDNFDTIDNVINIDDFPGLHACFTGPGSFYTPDDPCSVNDIDQDGDVDLDDFASFMLVYSGPRRDCNGNGIIDLQDILVGFSADVDNNGIPDSCQPTCDNDVNGTGTVNVDDLLAVINQWGNCPAVPAPCSGDVNVSGAVDVDDLLAIINGWGPCP